MDLTVNNRIIAAVEIRPVQLGRLLGAFELVISFSGTVHPAGDGTHRSLTIAGARITLRAKSGKTVQMGRAVPDNVAIVRAHWSQILRIIASIRTGTVTASLIMRQLAAYPRQNGVAAALR